jgi:hypothetical protein
MDVQAAMRVKGRALQKQVGEGEADVLCELKLLLFEGVAIIRLSTRATFDSPPPIVFTHARHCMPTLRTCVKLTRRVRPTAGNAKRTHGTDPSKRARRLVVASTATREQWNLYGKRGAV